MLYFGFSLSLRAVKEDLQCPLIEFLFRNERKGRSIRESGASITILMRC